MSVLCYFIVKLVPGTPTNLKQVIHNSHYSRYKINCNEVSTTSFDRWIDGNNFFLDLDNIEEKRRNTYIT